MESHEWDIECRGIRSIYFVLFVRVPAGHFFSQAEFFTTDTIWPICLDMSQIILSGTRWEPLRQFLYLILHLSHSMLLRKMREGQNFMSWK
jgi:hypothetical protein